MALTRSQQYMQVVTTANVGGKTFRCSRRTKAHLYWTIARLKVRFPRCKLVVFQGSYNTTVKASAGTHDYDCALDVQIVGMSWDRAQSALRQWGWAAWHRTTAQGFSGDHIHMISIPPGLNYKPSDAQVLAAYHAIGLEVGRFVPGQVSDYYNHALGLAGKHNSGSDPTWHPKSINKTVFRQE